MDNLHDNLPNELLTSLIWKYVNHLGKLDFLPTVMVAFSRLKLLCMKQVKVSTSGYSKDADK